ncbi:hypothetical protein ACH4VR_29195 [Streptomyces sp. NPDC020883]|uniref:hypothetical protein n=1 Tax=Streptomyces sp. NPDC020883 TaxID=3365099 RepID=UPI0037A1F485
MTTHTAQQEWTPRTDKQQRTKPVPPAARDFARRHGDVGRWSTEMLKQYVELGGV